MRKLAFVLAISLLGAGLAFASSMPKLDIQATCRRALPLSVGEKSAYQSCMNDETEAMKELAKIWSSFKPGPQATCVNETKIGGAASYVELLTCLQLDKQAADAVRENQKTLTLPSSKPDSPSGGSGATPSGSRKPK